MKWLRLKVWELQFCWIAWRRWKSFRMAWCCSRATDDPLDDREAPYESVLTEESYMDD